MAESLDLLDEEVDVLESSCGVGDHHAEEVHLVPLRLVADHGCAVLHHPGFYYRSHLEADRFRFRHSHEIAFKTKLNAVTSTTVITSRTLWDEFYKVEECMPSMHSLSSVCSGSGHRGSTSRSRETQASVPLATSATSI